MDKFLRFFRLYGPSIAVAMTILYISVMPNPPKVDTGISFADKLVHCAMYAALTAVLCYNLYKDYFEFHSLPMLIIAVACPIIFGGLVELTQAYLTTSRSGEWLDFAANSIGVLLSYGICSYFYPRNFEPNNN